MDYFFLILSSFFNVVLTNMDIECALARCRINPGTPCEVTTTTSGESLSCPSPLNPKLPDGGYRDLSGTPVDVRVERIDNTGEPILDITWKPPKQDPTTPRVDKFAVFIQAYDLKDSFKLKCLDRWYAVTNGFNSSWPDNKSITLRLKCPFFFDKWLFVYINSIFNTTTSCFIRQAHVVHKSTDTPRGLPDYRLRLDPQGADEINVNFEPTPGIDHQILWCNSSQKTDCRRNPCQKAFLKAGYGNTVFKSIRSCQSYTLKICPAVDPRIAIYYVAKVFIPALNLDSVPASNKMSIIGTSSDLEASSTSIYEPQSSSTTTSDLQTVDSSESQLAWIVVGGLILSALILSLLLYWRFRSGNSLNCLGREIKISLRSNTKRSNNPSDGLPDEQLVFFSKDAQTVPVFYYPDNQEHVEKINWWITRIQKSGGDNFYLKLVSVIDPIFSQMITTSFTKQLDVFSVLFVVSSKCLHNYLPCMKLKDKSSPIKQNVIRFLKDRHNKVCILDYGEEENGDLPNIQMLLDLDNVIYLNEGQADQSIKQLLVILKDQENQTFYKKIDESPDNMALGSPDGGYYSGETFNHSNIKDKETLTSFFPPEIEAANSERSIIQQLEEINQRCSTEYDDLYGIYIEHIPASKSVDTLSI